MEEVEQESILHTAPELVLQHPVLARRTELKLVSGGLTVKLFKQEDKKWDQLSPAKFHWIKIDPEFFEDLSDDDVLDQDIPKAPTVGNTGENEFQPQVCLEKYLFSL